MECGRSVVRQISVGSCSTYAGVQRRSGSLAVVFVRIGPAVLGQNLRGEHERARGKDAAQEVSAADILYAHAISFAAALIAERMR